MPWETMAGRSGLTHCRVQPPDAENRMSGGVGGSRCAIAVTRPDLKMQGRFESRPCQIFLTSSMVNS
jgi:hypothetical protein